MGFIQKEWFYDRINPMWVGQIDTSQKQQLVKVNAELLETANTIYNKIETMQQTIDALRAQEGYESEYLDNQLARFKGLFSKYNKLNKKQATLDAMMEDELLKERSEYTTYILMALGAIVVMLITYKVMHRKNLMIYKSYYISFSTNIISFFILYNVRS